MWSEGSRLSAEPQLTLEDWSNLEFLPRPKTAFGQEMPLLRVVQLMEKGPVVRLMGVPP
jgi:hypothetical protein